jgi:hypothetical protein
MLLFGIYLSVNAGKEGIDIIYGLLEFWYFGKLFDSNLISLLYNR